MLLSAVFLQPKETLLEILNHQTQENLKKRYFKSRKAEKPDNLYNKNSAHLPTGSSGSDFPMEAE